MALANNVTIYQSRSSSKVADGLIITKQRVWTDEYEAAALAIGQTIAIADLPAGAKVQEVVIYFDALGGGTTLSAGDSTSATRYFAAASTAAAGSIVSDLVDGVNYVIGTNDGDNEILLTVAGGAITGTIKSVVKYTLS